VVIRGKIGCALIGMGGYPLWPGDVALFGNASAMVVVPFLPSAV
jgi:hypothetical protein